MIIKEKVLSPYYIRVGEHSYDVMKPSGKGDDRVVGYFTILHTALYKIAKLKTMDAESEVTVKEYIFLLKGFVDSLKEEVTVT